MELNSKIKFEDIITPFNTDKAKLYEYGYFAQNLIEYTEVEECFYGELTKIDSESYRPFTTGHDIESVDFSYFIPESKLLNTIQRPFTFEEFTSIFKIGDIIKYRKKNDTYRVYNVVFNGYIDDISASKPVLILGCKNYTTDNLFESYEYFSNGWKPFGTN